MELVYSPEIKENGRAQTNLWAIPVPSNFNQKVKKKSQIVKSRKNITLRKSTWIRCCVCSWKRNEEGCYYSSMGKLEKDKDHDMWRTPDGLSPWTINRMRVAEITEEFMLLTNLLLSINSFYKFTDLYYSYVIESCNPNTQSTEFLWFFISLFYN